MYDHDPGGFVVLVIGHCVNTMEAKMETAPFGRGRWS